MHLHRLYSHKLAATFLAVVLSLDRGRLSSKFVKTNSKMFDADDAIRCLVQMRVGDRRQLSTSTTSRPHTIQILMQTECHNASVQSLTQLGCRSQVEAGYTTAPVPASASTHKPPLP